jgi:hypothetical protein
VVGRSMVGCIVDKLNNAGMLCDGEQTHANTIPLLQSCRQM